MVCNRCTLAVQDILQSLKITNATVGLGEINFSKEPAANKLQQLKTRLEEIGFEILDNQNQQTIETIKNLLIQKVQSLDLGEHFSLIDFLSKKLLKDYAGISRLFSQVEGITIEQFFILQKIEKVKELLYYGEHTLSEIAWKLGYSSVQHLSAQFKKITGLTPTQLKELNTPYRKSLDKVK